MKLTSAQAAKLLKKFNDEREALLDAESRSCKFNAAVGEDPETVRPAYNYGETQKQIAELDGRIRALKHALNVFNSTHKVPGFDMTVDEMLVYIPQLTQTKQKLAEMRAHLPKSRVDTYGRMSNIIDYTYLNYSLDEVNEDYTRVSDELYKAQLALDSFNNSEIFEF